MLRGSTLSGENVEFLSRVLFSPFSLFSFTASFVVSIHKGGQEMVEITNRKDSVVLFLVEEVMREIWKSCI